jgi:hypothetical protein
MMLAKKAPKLGANSLCIPKARVDRSCVWKRKEMSLYTEDGARYKLCPFAFSGQWHNELHRV